MSNVCLAEDFNVLRDELDIVIISNSNNKLISN